MLHIKYRKTLCAELPSKTIHMFTLVEPVADGDWYKNNHAESSDDAGHKSMSYWLMKSGLIAEQKEWWKQCTFEEA